MKYIETRCKKAIAVQTVPTDFGRHTLLRLLHSQLDELLDHQSEVVLFGLATGLRQSNVLRLERWQVIF